MTAVFDDVRLPVDIEVGATGGPEWKTTIVDFSSGSEQRNQDWSEHRCTFDIGYGISNIDDLRAVLAFHYARRGRARPFRFKDWTDFNLQDEPIATGNGVLTDFQIIKTYESSGPNPYGRRITRPVASTLVVKVNGVVTTVTLNALGMIHFSSPPANLSTITVTCEFDIPCRFDSDKLAINLEAFNAGSVANIIIQEVRE